MCLECVSADRSAHLLYHSQWPMYVFSKTFKALSLFLTNFTNFQGFQRPVGPVKWFAESEFYSSKLQTCDTLYMWAPALIAHTLQTAVLWLLRSPSSVRPHTNTPSRPPPHFHRRLKALQTWSRSKLLSAHSGDAPLRFGRNITARLDLAVRRCGTFKGL